MIPHVTVHEDADMTELEEFRKVLNKEWEKAGKPLVLGTAAVEQKCR